jgi:sec-independent protein translocase protein TatB
MFEIGFPELVLIAIVGLLVIGPERLPEALRTLGLWLGRMRRSFTAVKAEIEKEIGMDEVKRQLHNEAIMEEMKRIEAEVKNTADSARSDRPRLTCRDGRRNCSPGRPCRHRESSAGHRR